MQWGFDWLLSFVNGFWGYIVQVVQWLVQGIIYAVEMGLYFAWDGLLTVMSALIEGLNLGNIATQTAAGWGLLPSPAGVLDSAVRDCKRSFDDRDRGCYQDDVESYSVLADEVVSSSCFLPKSSTR